ncbi:MAG: aliphatic sulfonate ABC transporter substrate-binding protein [Aeromicrobium sp.]|uniref:aliphatic sulfonate ABC transporter substrate-binding protein n=1 Tax=Aeromicrobium sp. TaxID=1871063 RepID=UPI0039E65265
MRKTLVLLFATLLSATALTSACGQDSDVTADGDVVIKVGVPRNFGIFSTMWVRDVQPEGVKIEYSYFPNFSDMLQALNAGKIDMTEVGDIGAISSWVNGGQVQAVGVSQPNPQQEGILVPADSDIQGPGDLKGKRINLLRSTNAYPFVLNYIAEAGLTEDDIEIVEITGPDALAAYENGDLDAFSTIDPQMADAQERTGSRLLTTAEGYVENLYPYVATTQAIEDKAEAVEAVLAAVADTMAWIPQNREEQARLLAPKLGFSESAIITAYGRGAEGLQVIDDDFLDGEQDWADTYTELGILTKKVDVREVFLTGFNDAVAGSGS